MKQITKMKLKTDFPNLKWVEKHEHKPSFCVEAKLGGGFKVGVSIGDDGSGFIFLSRAGFARSMKIDKSTPNWKAAFIQYLSEITPTNDLKEGVEYLKKA